MSKPIWLEHALKDAGVCEIRGGENPRIIEMFTHTSYHATEDEIHWCSAGCCAWLEECGFPSPHRADAKSFIGYGVELDDFREGCIVVLQSIDAIEKGMTDSGFHVGLGLELSKDCVWLWGANQGNSVKKSGFKLRSYRIRYMGWPAGVK